jgi:type IV pilus secretin PilQ/predicted competence protein
MRALSGVTVKLMAAIGKMHRQGILFFGMLLVGLCVITAGCAPSFVPLRRDLSLVGPMGSAEAADAHPHAPLPTDPLDKRLPKDGIGVFSRPILTPGPSPATGEGRSVSRAGTKKDVTGSRSVYASHSKTLPLLGEVAQPILTDVDHDIPLIPVQFKQVRSSESEVVPLPQPQGTLVGGLPGLPETAAISGGGPLITIHADNQDVRKTLEMVSRQAKMNILVSPGISGAVTLDLRDKTIDETLRAIAKLCNLAIRREKDVLYISTPAEVRQGEQHDLPVRVYHLNYVRSGDLDSMIHPLLSEEGKLTTSPESEMGIKTDAEKAGGNLMAGGEIVVVQDYEQVLKTVDRVVAQIDVQPIQVLIEAVILQVKLEKDMELGINFAVLDGAGNALGVLGNGAAINAAAGFTPASVLTAGGKLVGTASSGFAENANGVKFGWVGNNTTGFLRALETRAETKVLASPRLLVLNKQRAEIQLGDRLGYQTATQTQTSTVQKVEFMDVGTLLRLRPFVSSDGVIRMEIHPERSSGALDDAGVPQTHSAQVTTNVMIPDGATIVIGGLIDNETRKDWEGIPFLSRIPVLGYLFRHTIDDTTKKELIVILTPHIVRPECPAATNYLGRPRALGLEGRVSQLPCAEAKDGPSLFEIPPPAACPEPGD